MSKKLKPRLSKGILEMKFMQRTKAKVQKDIEDADGCSEMYSKEITNKMLHSSTNFILEPSYMHCESLKEGRLSFRGMNPEIERLLELEAETEARKQNGQRTEVSDKEMLAFYNAQLAPTASKTMHKKFQTKNERGGQKRKNKAPNNVDGNEKKPKFLKPSDNDD